MLVGIGTDLVEIARIKRVWQRQGMRFAQRILTAEELEVFSHHAQPEHFLAKRWAVKEAVSKALGTGMAQGVSFESISLSHSELGQPQICLSGAAQQRAEQLQINDWQVSISDERHYALAFVAAQKVSKD